MGTEPNTPIEVGFRKQLFFIRVFAATKVTPSLPKPHPDLDVFLLHALPPRKLWFATHLPYESPRL